MFRLVLSPGSKSDLTDLKQTSPDVAAMAIVVLQEIQADQKLLDTLTIHAFEDVLPISEAKYDVKHWWTYYKKGLNLWRLKIVDIDKFLFGYRIIYGYSQSEQKYYVLGILSRNFDYDPNHPTTKRILREYEDLCI